jgi:hypothetical protein
MENNDLDFSNVQLWTKEKPLPDRERFSPNESNKLFLKECRERGYDISTIINLALDTFCPKTKSNYFTWDGVDKVVSGKKKWF